MPEYYFHERYMISVRSSAMLEATFLSKSRRRRAMLIEGKRDVVAYHL